MVTFLGRTSMIYTIIVKHSTYIITHMLVHNSVNLQYISTKNTIILGNWGNRRVNLKYAGEEG